MEKLVSTAVEHQRTSVSGKRFLIVQFLFNLGTAFSGMFINLFLWNLNQSLHTLEMMYLLQSLVILVGFPLCSIVARKVGHLICWQAGILLYLLSYLLLLILQDKSALYYGWIGVLSGLAMSFNAIGMHIFNMDTTKDANRDRFLSYSLILASLAGIFAPVISGSIVASFVGIKGYYLVFGVSSFLFIASILLSTGIPRKPVHGTSHLLEIMFRPSTKWRRMLNATFIWGSIDGIYNTFLVTLVIYLISGSTHWVGLFITAQNIVSLAASSIYARKMHPGNRGTYYLLGSLLLFISSIILAIHPSWLVLLSQTLLAGAALPAFNIPMSSKIYELIEADRNFEHKRLDYIVAREIPLGTGRTIGLLLFMVCSTLWHGQRFLLLTLAVLSGLYVILYPLIRNRIGDLETP